MLDAPNLDLQLARLLNQGSRLDVATLQGLMAQVRADPGGPTLARALVQHGLLPEQEVLGYLQQLGGSLQPSLGASTARKTGSSSRLGKAGERVGEYLLVKRLGAGGMGSVHLAEHVTTGARYAIKILSSGSMESRRRFQREGEAQARVDHHPNVVNVHLAGEEGSRAFLVMELADGGDLDTLIKEEGPLEPWEAARLVSQLARGLHHVHQHGVLHRDLKPANVLFDDLRTPMLVDFGLARLEGEGTLTKTGALMGTPAYMPPEQARGKNRELDARCDVYSLGAVFYEALTGQPPFSGAPVSILAAVIREEPPTPRSLRPEIPAELEAVCRRAMAKAPEDRYATAAELARALEQPQDEVVPTRISRSFLGTGIALVVLSIAAAALIVALLKAPTSRIAPDEANKRATELARETRVALRSAQPLRDDAERIGGWRTRLSNLEADLGDSDPPRNLERAETHLLALEGLLALEQDDLAQAKVKLDVLERRAPDRPHTLALAGGVAALDKRGDPDRAVADLDRAIASGIQRPALGRWRVRGIVRQAQVDLMEDRPRDGLRRLQGLGPQVEEAPEEALDAVASQAGRSIDNHFRGLKGLPRDQPLPARRIGPVRDLLRVLLLLERPVPQTTFDELFAFATEPHRLVQQLAPLLARFKPDEFRIQLETAEHYRYIKRYDLSPQLAALYLPPAQRAAELAPSAAERRRLGVFLCKRLVQAHKYPECIATATKLLETRGLSPAERAGLLEQRGTAQLELGRLKGALADLDQAVGKASPTIHHQRARALWAMNHPLEALESALVFVDAVKPDFAPAYNHSYPRAVLLVWQAAQRLRRPDKARYAVEQLLRRFPGARFAGWHLRLAELQLSQGDIASALGTLDRVTALLPRNQLLRSMVQWVQKTYTQLRKKETEAAKKNLRAQVRQLEALRLEGHPTP